MVWLKNAFGILSFPDLQYEMVGSDIGQKLPLNHGLTMKCKQYDVVRIIAFNIELAA